MVPLVGIDTITSRPVNTLELKSICITVLYELVKALAHESHPMEHHRLRLGHIL